MDKLKEYKCKLCGHEGSAEDFLNISDEIGVKSFIRCEECGHADVRPTSPAHPALEEVIADEETALKARMAGIPPQQQHSYY